MLDLRNFGESDGTPEGITYGDLEMNDVVGAVDFLAARAPTLPVAAIGFSMGGATALRAAARDHRLRAVVADSAYADARGVAASFTSAATGIPALFAAPFVWSAQYLHGVPLARGATVEALRGATLPPVLLIHGERDDLIPAQALFMAAQTLAALDIPVEWHLSPGIGHGIDAEGLRHGGEFLARAFRLTA